MTFELHEIFSELGFPAPEYFPGKCAWALMFGEMWDTCGDPRDEMCEAFFRFRKIGDLYGENYDLVLSRNQLRVILVSMRDSEQVREFILDDPETAIRAMLETEGSI